MHVLDIKKCLRTTQELTISAMYVGFHDTKAEKSTENHGSCGVDTSLCVRKINQLHEVIVTWR